MAELNVEHKQKSVWPWVVGVIVALLIIWALFMFLGTDDVDADRPLPAQTMSTPAQANPADSVAANWIRSDSLRSIA